jgi:hypothetical protein
VIRDGDSDLEHVGNRSQHALGLTQRLMEYQAQREAGLDSDRRIDRLSAPLSGSCSGSHSKCGGRTMDAFLGSD